MSFYKIGYILSILFFLISINYVILVSHKILRETWENFNYYLIGIFLVILAIAIFLLFFSIFLHRRYRKKESIKIKDQNQNDSSRTDPDLEVRKSLMGNIANQYKNYKNNLSGRIVRAPGIR